jgi:hypothetical protein
MIQTATKIRILGLVILIIIALTPQPQNTNTINDILKQSKYVRFIKRLL